MKRTLSSSKLLSFSGFNITTTKQKVILSHFIVEILQTNIAFS